MRILLILLFLMGNSAFGQNKIRPFVEIGYGKNLIEGFYLSNVLEVGVGVKLNQHFYFQLNFMQAKDIRQYFNNDYYTSRILSLSSSYRMLKDKHIISPIFTLDMGAEIWSNARSKLVYFSGSSILIEDKYEQVMYLYNKGTFFGKFKFQADIKLKNFNLLIGGGYSYYRFNVDYLKPESISLIPEGYSFDYNGFRLKNGFSLETSLRYTLPIKKKKE